MSRLLVVEGLPVGCPSLKIVFVIFDVQEHLLESRFFQLHKKPPRRVERELSPTEQKASQPFVAK